MLPKLNLDKGKTYEHAVVAKRIATMLLAYVRGQQHDISLGVERGVSKWDDIVIEKKIDTYEHVQIKRQLSTDFSGAPAIRDTYKKGAKVGKPRDLSPLDESIEGLAQWAASEMTKRSGIGRSFSLILPIGSIQIKKGLTITDFLKFRQSIVSSTTGNALDKLALADNKTKECIDWLKSWCGFRDSDQIVFAMKVLAISNDGTETEYDNLSKEKLTEMFTDVDQVLTKVKGFIVENSVFTGSITSRALLLELSSHLRPEYATWTQYTSDGDSSIVSGIHDLEELDKFERAEKIVPALWGNDRKRNLKIATTKVDNSVSTPAQEIFQLAIHLRGNSTGLCFDWLGWQSCLHEKLGGTLGNGKDDFENISISESSEPFEVAEKTILDTLDKKEGFAKELSNEMIAITWKYVAEAVSKIIRELNVEGSNELRASVEKRWAEWKKVLGKNTPEQHRLFKKMLHPATEGNDILGKMRVGPKTVTLIADGLFLLLVVSVALKAEDTDWIKTDNSDSIEVIGLKYWSGPAGSVRRVQEIDDIKNVRHLVGGETSQILILSKSNMSDAEINQDLLASDKESRLTLASPSRPKLIVTNSVTFKRLIDDGKIAPVKAFLETAIDEYDKAVKEKIDSLK